MNEKTKKYLLSLGVRSIVATVLFLAIWVVRGFYPDISRLWTKNMNIEKIITLFREIIKEV